MTRDFYVMGLIMGFASYSSHFLGYEYGPKSYVIFFITALFCMLPWLMFQLFAGNDLDYPTWKNCAYAGSIISFASATCLFLIKFGLLDFTTGFFYGSVLYGMSLIPGIYLAIELHRYKR